jgi:hypothetical protein
MPPRDPVFGAMVLFLALVFARTFARKNPIKLFEYRLPKPLFPLMAKTMEGLPQNGPPIEYKMENQNEKQLLGKFTKGYRVKI